MKSITLFLLACTMSFSCKKDVRTSSGVVAVKVTNAIVGGPNIGFNSLPGDSVVNLNAKTFNLEAGNQNLLIYSRINTSRVLFTGTQAMHTGEIYSIFLTGLDSSPEAVLLKETIPVNSSDSTFGIRLINLSPNSTPLNVTLASNPSVNLFSSIQYKQLTNYTRLSLKPPVAAGTVTFQIRNSTSNAILATYVLPASVNGNYPNISTTLSRNKSITLVIKGLQGVMTGTTAFGVFPIANY